MGEIKFKTHIQKITLLMILSVIFLTSCNQEGGGGSRKRGGLTGVVEGGDNTTGTGGGQGDNAGPGNGDIGSGDEDGSIFSQGRAELRHIVDPFTGTYKTKVTIPKNYKGPLYLSGLNITGLRDKYLSVRFRFGRSKADFTMLATVGRAPGITPQTDVEVLILDLDNQPFKDIRLPYDLYDYNDYDSNGDGVEFGAGDDHSEPTNDVRDAGLYCRGLLLEDDPTFTITTSNDKCDSSDETCLYAYAKIVDAGLSFINDDGDLESITPTEPQIDTGGLGYGNLAQDDLLKRCLPDSPSITANNNVLQTNLNTTSTAGASYGDGAYGNEFSYFGPYRVLNQRDWEITGDAIFSPINSSGDKPTGIYQSILSGSPSNSTSLPVNTAEGGYNSFLFPRSGRYSNFRPNVEYIGKNSALDESRSLTSLVTAGDSNLVDGCNLRVSNYDDYTTEGMGSCNVTASIEILYLDNDTGTLKTLVTNNNLKLQLSRRSLTDFEGNEIDFGALKKCSNSNSCGANECCFNERCWSKNLVSQCFEDDSGGNGSFKVGEACSSDFQCSSLCCSNNTGTCEVHNPSTDNFCSKAPGNQCVTKEFCRKEPVPTCIVVKEGVNQNGEVQCRRQCFYIDTFGECMSGRCVPPTIPDPQPFDENDPNRCDTAVDPPSDIDSL